MTSRHRTTSERPPSVTHRIRGGRLCPTAALFIFSMGLGGCAHGVAARRPEPQVLGSQVKTSDLDQRIREARERTALDPAEPYWAYRLGQLYLAADSVTQAEAALQSCLAREPYYVPALALLSKRYFDTGRHMEAVEMLEAARSRPDRFPGGFPRVLQDGLALHYDALDRIDQAEDLVSSPPGEDAPSPAVYVKLRGVHPESATEPAAAAVRANPKNAVHQNNYGITRLRAGDPVAARRAFLAAIEIDPRLPGPYYNLAILDKYYLFDDASAAGWFKAYRERAQQDPDSLFGIFERGGTQDLAGR